MNESVTGNYITLMTFAQNYNAAANVGDGVWT